MVCSKPSIVHLHLPFFFSKFYFYFAMAPIDWTWPSLPKLALTFPNLPKLGLAQFGFGDFPKPMHWSLLRICLRAPWIESVAQVRWIIVQILLKFFFLCFSKKTTDLILTFLTKWICSWNQRHVCSCVVWSFDISTAR